MSARSSRSRPSDEGEDELQSQLSQAKGSEMGDDDVRAPRLTPVNVEDDDPDFENTFRIMLATDCHLGYMEAEDKEGRGQDSFRAFREILELAKELDVDFVLLAGDLFHHSNPSTYTLTETMKLLREFTQGDDPVRIELLSDPDEGKVGNWQFPMVNYEDYNINISLPVFSIHGNHDDPIGITPAGALSTLDILSTAGLLNYFGKTDLPRNSKLTADGTVQGLTVEPVLLKKGTSHLALYGMGNVKDVRMNAELRGGRVVMRKPLPQEGVDWFNIVLVHQNRVAHNRNEYVPENMFDDDTDLVVWGHEHDCRIVPEPVADRHYYITQPGSSVATSLTEGEAIEKKVGLMVVRKKEFFIDPISLKTVRPFVIKHLIMEDEAEKSGLDLSNKVKVTEWLRDKVMECVKEANAEWDRKNLGEDPSSKEVEQAQRPKPLIRLKIETTGMELINRARFGERMTAVVANPGDLLQFYQKKKPVKRKTKVTVDQPEAFLEEGDEEDSDKPKITMSALVNKYLAAQELKVLAEGGMEKAIEEFVKGNKTAIKSFVSTTLKFYHDAAKKGDFKEEQIEDELDRQKFLKQKEYVPEGGGSAQHSPAPRGGPDSMDVDSEAHDSDTSTVASIKGIGKAVSAKKAPAASSSKGKGKAPAKQKKLFDDDEESSGSEIVLGNDSDDSDDAPPKRRGKKTPAAKASAKKAPARNPAPKSKTPAPGQSQLSFAPPPRATASRVSKAKPQVVELDDSDSD